MGLRKEQVELTEETILQEVNSSGGKRISVQQAQLPHQELEAAVYSLMPETKTAKGGVVKDWIKGFVSVKRDQLTNLVNMFPSISKVGPFERVEGAISGAPGAVIHNQFKPGASLGDMSWLIYKNRLDTNPEMKDKWNLYKDISTTHGFNCRTYVDEASKQIVITLEGTQSDKEGSSFYFSKDVLSDLEIGLGVIPPQVREGYEEFKKLMNDLSKDFGSDYGLSVAGHSLGGALAQMMAGMYFLDTGVALPALAEAAPGMLRQLKIYAMQQLIDGNEIYLPSGGTLCLKDVGYLKRVDQAKAVVNTFKAQDFSNIINIITEADPIGNVNYDANPDKAGHVGTTMVIPYFLTPRELLMDDRYEKLKKLQAMGIVTPENMPDTPLGLLAGLDNIDISRVDRHEPEQSVSIWAGDIVQWDPSFPDKGWSGSNITLSGETMFGTSGDDIIVTSDKATTVMGGNGRDAIEGGNGGNFLSGGDGDDFIRSGDGDDYLSGDAGNDILYGGGGNDILYGGAGNDFLDGGVGDDLLFGGSGNDTLVWEKGNDILNGQEGDDTYIIKGGADGGAQIKWDRNYTNFGNDQVVFEGAMADGSNLLFNFTDEIRFYDMKWMQQGNDIVMIDPRGDKNASVTFENAFDTFAQNSGKIDFKFTNGKLYKDDILFNVLGGSQELHASDDSLYKGSFLVGSSANDTFYAGKGDDLIFAGSGADKFIFGDVYGNNRIVGGDADDEVFFTSIFDSASYTIAKKDNDLVIGYQSTTDGLTQSLTFSDWYTSDNRVNRFTFGDASYKINNASFERI